MTKSENDSQNEGDGSDISNSSSSSSSQQSRPMSTARVGGRRSSPPPPKRNNKKDTDDNVFGLLKFVLPIMALIWLLQSLLSGIFFFGGGGSSTGNYVYYQSSTFESRTIKSDGTIETAKKESVRTNMPSLIKSGESSSSSSSSTSSMILRGERDEAFERELENDVKREIDSAMQQVMPRSIILDDFF
eukprot:CAMPEP_0185725120 /NCGR_PEP_ID=MMETSP1171-20130828/1448_1 /TAXON_ID=374046 /ORGANISM="Helicotheca tamensis, Strain CCMP826" /LENGTH=187 /DNA_ID=CAMNT_0028393157 /DNA_START=372 /DNA_END=935 /DNA_ORIENTATION=+